MGCGPCSAGGGTIFLPDGAMYDSAPRPDGTYFLATYPECEGGHHGQYEGLSIYVVGRGDVNIERLFVNADLADASDYMNSFPSRPSIEKISSSSLCSEAVIATYG